MTMQGLADRLLDCIKHGANPDQPVMCYDADAEEVLEVRCFTYGGQADAVCRLYCDED